MSGLKVAALTFLAAGLASPQSPDNSKPAPAAVISQYCVTCHNAKLKTAGVVLDPSEASHAASDMATWEKVIAKLRSNSMPPAGLPSPGPAVLSSVAGQLETQIDQAALQHPNPGSLPLLHRLTRTEYQNAIRDLLAVDAPPKEMDYSILLPADNSSSGFDNLADLLFVSPTAMERYLDAAQKISSLAVGDTSMPVMVNIYKVPDEQPQDEQVAGLPFGTRGGLAIHSDFPVTGEYAIKVELSGASPEPEQLEISVDGKRLQLVTVGGSAPANGHPVSRKVDAPPKPQEFRIPIQAGSRLIGITFIQQDETRDEQVLRLENRSRGTRIAVASATISGPYGVKSSGESTSQQRIFICRPASADEELPCAKRILSTLERRAYRRPVMDADLEPLLAFYKSGRAEGSFETGIERALERLLVSPQFLFRIEHDPPNIPPGTPYRISDLELASRLSFFLWSSIPDDELINIAATGKLHQPAVLKQQVARMMADQRSESLVTNFAEQWLYLRDIEAKTPDDLMFQDFDENLRAAFREETDLFLNEVLRGDHSVLDLLTANYTFLNERLAKHYGIPNVQGNWFRRVTLPADSPRGGLLGQGSILTITSMATRTSPVVRGKWVLENLLSSPPPPPPPNVPALKTEASAGAALSMREAMTQHRANPACAGCHARMDPIGFAMENFDAIGRWRTRDAGKPIDASGVLPDGTKFEGVQGLKKVLLAHPEQFVNTIAGKLLMYAIGRNVQYYDIPVVRAIVRQAATENYTFSSLVLGVVSSEPFQMRKAQTARTHRPAEAPGEARQSGF